MMDEYWKPRGSQIPAFGDWEYVNDLPITQYFECARQAGLIRYSSSSGECDHPHSSDLYTVVSRPAPPPRSKQGKGRERRGSYGKEGGRKQGGNGKVFDVTVTEAAGKRHPPSAIKKQQQQHFQYDTGLSAQPRKVPKPVDEDLYKIPPELLKRKKRLGFFSRCLVPPCAV